MEEIHIFQTLALYGVKVVILLFRLIVLVVDILVMVVVMVVMEVQQLAGVAAAEVLADILAMVDLLTLEVVILDLAAAEAVALVTQMLTLMIINAKAAAVVELVF